MPVLVDHAQTRIEIAELAGEIVATEGLNALTMRRMAEAAGTSRAIVSTYFANMQDLISATYLRYADRQGARFTEALEAGGGLEECVAAILPLDADRLHDWNVLVAFIGVTITDPVLSPIARKRHDSAVVKFENLLLAHNPDMRMSAKVTYEARRIVNTLHGVGIDLTYRSDVPLTAADKRRIVREILNGPIGE